MIHTFTVSGLGEAPFSLCHPNALEARANTAFYCEHCGTTLKNRFFVKSNDGKVSVVGIDCLSKTGDQGLIDGEKRLRQKLRDEAREARVNAAMAEREAEDRQRFGGKSREEVIATLEAKIEALQSAHMEAVEAHPATDLLSLHGFELAMTHRAYSGESFSKGMLSTLVSIFAKKKSGARKNSKAYKEALPEAQALAGDYQELILKHEKSVEQLRTQIRDLLVGL